MFPFSARTLVSAVGLLVVSVIVVSLPLGYAVMSFSRIAQMRSFEASLNARRVSTYASQNGSAWSTHRARLTPLVELWRGDQSHVQALLTTQDGELVLSMGDTPTLPVLSRYAPVVVNGTVVGRVEVRTSLAPLLIRTGVVALLSAALGFVAYLAIRIFPLRTLDRTVAELHARERELSTRNTQFDAALANMPYGLCMFDEDERLVICNEQYRGMYQLPARLTWPGTQLYDIWAYRIAIGNAPADMTTHAIRHAELIKTRGAAIFDCLLQNGAVVRISRRPVPSGGFVAAHEDVTVSAKAEAQLAHMAHHDALTGLANRVLLRQQLEQTVSRTRRGDKLALLYLDLDRFKSVNDTLGHPVGDELLRAVAARLLACARESDTVARLGGDEFAIIARGAGESELCRPLAQRVVDALCTPFELSGHHVSIGTSVGIALAPSDSEDPDQLLKLADLALYRAKANGRGTYCFYDAEMSAKSQEPQTVARAS